MKARPSLAPHRSLAPARFLWPLPLCLLLAGCGLGRYIENGFQVGPNYAAPAPDQAAKWVDDTPKGLQRTDAELQQWWQTFHDDKLSSLIEEAARQNLSLQASLARVAEAGARLGIARANLFPQQQALSGGITNIQASRNGIQPVRDRYFQDWQVGIGASWELDIWGRYRRAIEASSADLEASQADHDDVTVLLLTEVAATYVRYRTSQERLSAARRNVELQEKNVNVTKARFAAGAVSQRDVEMAMQVLAQTRALVPTIEFSLRQANNELCILLGKPVTDLTERLGANGRVPDAPAEVAIGAPADLMRRRPDIRSAERQLAAQSARIGIAESDLLPHLSLSGGLGVEAARSSSLFDSGSLTSFVGPSFRWDLFNYGKFENNITAQEERYKQLEFRYREAVLTAGREAEDAIAALLTSRESAAALLDSRNAASRALDITVAQYNEGATDVLAVVFFSSTLAQQDDAHAAARGAAALSLVQLYRSLGGGWQAPAAKP